MKKYLGRDIIRIIAYHTEVTGAGIKLIEISLKEVALTDSPLGGQLREVGVEISHALGVDLGHCDVMTVLQKELSEHTHAGSDLKHGETFISIERGRDAARYRQIGQEMLS